MIRILFSLGILFLCGTAAAHSDHDTVGVGFVVGLLHPILGFDHFLAMVSVGIVSYQIGGKAIWYVPGTFVGMMVVGGILGFYDIAVPLVESGIALSVIVLGLSIAASGSLPVGLALAFVSFFAIFHGHAHGQEMPDLANPYLYALGFVLGTAAIHLLGVAIGAIAGKFPDGPSFLRYVGAGIAGIGFHIILGG